METRPVPTPAREALNVTVALSLGQIARFAPDPDVAAHALEELKSLSARKAWGVPQGQVIELEVAR